MSYLNTILAFLFSNILTLSLQAAIIALVVLFINKIFKKRINPRLSYLLWGLVLIRLVIPVLPQSNISIFNAIDMKTSTAFQVLPRNIASADDYQNDQSSTLSSDLNSQKKSSLSDNNLLQNDTITNSAYNNTTTNQAIDWSSNLFIILAYIWLLGVLLIIGYLFFVNIAYARGLKKFESISLPETKVNDIRKKIGLNRKVCFVHSSSISSPSVFGILNHTILLPKGLVDAVDEKTLYNIVLHEFAHIKRNDLLLSWLSNVICALHWFNPILWYSAFAVRRCQEVCADAYVMSLIEDEEITGYGQTLLETSKKSPNSHGIVLVTAGINENKSALKDRIQNIAIFSKKKYHLTFVSIVLFAFIGLFLCTSSANIPKTPEEQIKFQNNIMFSVSSLQAKNSLQDINLEIHNKNSIGIWNCEIQLYNGPIPRAKDNAVYSNSFIRIGSGSKKSIIIHGIDYDTTYIRVSYTPGFPLSKNSVLWTEGPLKVHDSTVEINNWGSVSNEEIYSFLKENDITSIGTTEIYDFYTVVLFEKGTMTTGYYELWKDTKKNEVMSRLVQGSGQVKSPVSLFGGTASGNYPFANIVINDSAILALGDKMVIECTGRNINTNVSGQRGHTLETRGIGDIIKVLIYDKSDKLIYDGEKSLLRDVSLN